MIENPIPAAGQHHRQPQHFDPHSDPAYKWKVNLYIPETIGDADQCVVVTWFKREGDEIKIDDTLLELQVAKAAIDVPSPVNGRLVKILAKQGDVVDRGQVLAYLEA
jgi:pyruvate dehydrogenase E2 component (dihydrolipoamide acetyltransferase)